MFKHRKLIISLGLASMLITPTIQVNASTQIQDVKNGHWASKVIYQYVDNGYMPLSKDGCFYPSKSITRAEVAAVLVKTQKLPLNAQIELQATDLPKTHPQYKAFQKLVELGVFQNSAQLKPEGTLTRAQMAKIIALAFQIEVDSVNTKKFKDYSRTFWAKDYIESLADEGIITGRTKTSFVPNDPVSKAQFVTLVSRAKSFSSKVKNLEYAYDLLSHKYIETKKLNPNFVKDVVKLVNEERVSRNLTILQEDPYLNQLATIKLNDIIERKYFEHESPYYGFPWEMANYFDYEFRSLGENLAKNLTTPTSVMDGWMASARHKENILKSNYTHIGVAVKRDYNGNYYWVQMFSSK